jgi:hypothetical protein
MQKNSRPWTYALAAVLLVTFIVLLLALQGKI